ncbi:MULTISPECIES: ABC transporter ATP-binding protein [Paenibacillus]|uniref:ABC transporter ATP-binding protein n=1 Tax=Paenibacillus TaxID=44249 RepID=UPI002FDFB07C
MPNTLLRTEKLCKTFSTGGNQQHVLKNLDLDLLEGDFTIIMGSSGSGKSTLLYALSGMDKPTLGEIYFDGENITRYSESRLAVFRRTHCGFVFQQTYLLDNMSVMDNVLANGLLVNRNRRSVTAKAEQLFTQVGLPASSWGKFPSQLSGGEAQRVGIVRAFINSPSLVFADEPTGALNSASGDSVMDVMSEMNRDGQSIVLVTHDLNTALRGNRILYLRDGSIYGDLALGAFQNEQGGDRRERLKAFLAEMGW